MNIRDRLCEVCPDAKTRVGNQKRIQVLTCWCAVVERSSRKSTEIDEEVTLVEALRLQDCRIRCATSLLREFSKAPLCPLLRHLLLVHLRHQPFYGYREMKQIGLD